MFYSRPELRVRPSQRSTNVAYYQRNREREITRVRTRQASTLELLRRYRERPCADCHQSLAPYQMDFDHRDGATKSFRLTSSRAMLASRDVLIAEVAKCDVVCANCHRIRTQTRHSAAGPHAASLPGRSRYLERKRTAWREQSQLLDRLRDVPCADCKSRLPPCAMDFDHRDAAEKRSGVTRMVGRSGLARILAEVAKCDIVCANCHRARTHGRRATALGRE